MPMGCQGLPNWSQFGFLHLPSVIPEESSVRLVTAQIFTQLSFPRKTMVLSRVLTVKSAERG